MKNRGCIITSAVSIIRDWEVYYVDPIGLKGGWSRYHSPLNPITDSDLLGLITCGTDRGDLGTLLR